MNLMYKPSIYRWATLLLFSIEVFIAVFIPAQSFIRHSFGDFLVVILIYAFVKSFINVEAKYLAIGVLLFAFGVEFLQYFHFVDVVGIENKVLRIIIGTSFSVGDLVMYTLGCLTAYWVDQYFLVNNKIKIRR